MEIDQYMKSIKRESLAIAKMTARCVLYICYLFTLITARQHSLLCRALYSI